MTCNGKDVKEKLVKAFYIIRKGSCDTYIEVISEDENKIVFTFKDNDLDPRKLEVNKVIDLTKHIFWDITLTTKDTYYLFDISKDKVELTRLDDNLFKLDVCVEKPNMIYSPLGVKTTFNNLIIDTEFSFVYE